jgi:hypothetical protein
MAGDECRLVGCEVDRRRADLGWTGLLTSQGSAAPYRLEESGICRTSPREHAGLGMDLLPLLMSLWGSSALVLYGAMALTVIPLVPSSRASTRVNACTPPFAAE